MKSTIKLKAIKNKVEIGGTTASEASESTLQTYIKFLFTGFEE